MRERRPEVAHCRLQPFERAPEVVHLLALDHVLVGRRGLFGTHEVPLARSAQTFEHRFVSRETLGDPAVERVGALEVSALLGGGSVLHLGPLELPSGRVLTDPTILCDGDLLQIVDPRLDLFQEERGVRHERILRRALHLRLDEEPRRRDRRDEHRPVAPELGALLQRPDVAPDLRKDDVLGVDLVVGRLLLREDAGNRGVQLAQVGVHLAPPFSFVVLGHRGLLVARFARSPITSATSPTTRAPTIPGSGHTTTPSTVT